MLRALDSLKVVEHGGYWVRLPFRAIVLKLLQRLESSGIKNTYFQAPRPEILILGDVIVALPIFSPLFAVPMTSFMRTDSFLSQCLCDSLPDGFLWSHKHAVCTHEGGHKYQGVNAPKSNLEPMINTRFFTYRWENSEVCTSQSLRSLWG